MTCDPDDAEDVTQEVLLIILTKLSTFREESRFRTWVYRIVANHVINMKKRKTEKLLDSFAHYGRLIDDAPDIDLPDPKSLPVDLPLLLEEIKVSCMMAMLLCLNRGQRLIFILGEVFGVNDVIGSEIFEISKDNFRKRLSRARKSVYSFMKEKCGLVNRDNPCQCDRKARGLVESGSVDPGNLHFTSNHRQRISNVFEEKSSRFTDFYDTQCQKLFRDHPFLDAPDFVTTFREILNSSEFRDIFEFDE
jgi:RNA polymerase sigma factor (sigma-70 family)